MYGIIKEINVTVESTIETSTKVNEENSGSKPLETMLGLATVVGIPAYIISKKKNNK